MVEAFRKHMGSDPDLRLAQVLKTDADVTRRDWYVATSIVQWLATNIGSTIVEAAGYKYMKHHEDRVCREEKLPPVLGLTTEQMMEAVVTLDAIKAHADAVRNRPANQDRLADFGELVARTLGMIP